MSILSFLPKSISLTSSTSMVSQINAPGLLNLPREIRDLILSYCVFYPDLSILLSNHLERARQSFRTHFGDEISEQGLEELLPWSSFEQPQPLSMQTLGIFLVNRQISCEALEILHSETLMLNVPIPVTNSRNVRAVFITDFIGEATLQSIRRCHLEYSFTTMAESSGWYRTTNHLTDIWAERNSLLSLSVNVEPNVVAPFGAPRQEANTALFRRHIMSSLEDLSEKVHVNFTGAASVFIDHVTRGGRGFST